LFDFTKKDNVGVLSISGRLDAYTAPELKNRFKVLMEETRYFVFDLHALDFLDSTGLGSIVSCLKSATANGGDICIAQMADKPRMVFEITRAFKIFEIYDDLEAAVESFNI
jgi:anti-sigma B factor antagonist